MMGDESSSSSSFSQEVRGGETGLSVDFDTDPQNLRLLLL
jgi:hypothetical protein